MITNVECEDGTTPGGDYMACMNTARGGIDDATVTLNGVGTPYDCTGYRLPTESEWERAWDWYQSGYPVGTLSSSNQDPVDPGTGSYRVSRGGSWHFNAQNCRSAERYYYYYYYYYYSPGYRSNAPGGFDDADMQEFPVDKKVGGFTQKINLGLIS